MPSIHSKPLIPQVVYCGDLTTPAEQVPAEHMHQKLKALPGETKYGHPDFHLIALQMGRLMRGTACHKLIPGHTHTPKLWERAMKRAFQGERKVTGEYVPGFLAEYVQWTGKRASSKFSDCALGMMKYHQSQYVEKGGKNVTDLEQMAFELMNEREVAIRKAKALAAAVKAKKDARTKKNQHEEAEMGLRPAKKVPKGGDRRPSDALGKKTMSKEDVVNEYFNEFEELMMGGDDFEEKFVDGKTHLTFDEENVLERAAKKAKKKKNSRAAAEEEKLAKAAVPGGATSKKYAAGELKKVPRDLDPQEKLDDHWKDIKAEEGGVFSALNNLVAATTPVPETPTKKKLEKIGTLTKIIIDLMAERATYVAAGMTEAIASVDKMIGERQKERASLDSSAASLGAAFSDAASA